MRITFGICAHVDAGKTTLGESLLFHTGLLKKPGRVDHKDTLLDSSAVERERGITVYSDEASFTWKGDAYTLVDTPGHTDFEPETERAFSVLDYAILAVSAVEGVQSHTRTLWRSLRKLSIPTFVFINKTDRVGADKARVLSELKKLSDNFIDLTGFPDISAPWAEEVALRDESLLERYLSGECDIESWKRYLAEEIRSSRVFPVMSGSALSGEGVPEFWDVFHELTVTDWEERDELPTSLRLYKVRHADGMRLVYFKVLSGKLSVRDELPWGKVQRLFTSRGRKLSDTREIRAGELAAAAGLAEGRPGMVWGAETIPDSLIVPEPILSARVELPEGMLPVDGIGILRMAEDEEPTLSVTWDEELREIRVSVMGRIQLEVLRRELRERWNLPVTFGKCSIMYRETVAAPVRGCGHYEPLRHYAEVHLMLRPLPRGSGIRFKSVCHVDLLADSWQRLIGTHVLEKEHKGVLTGAPLTDTEIVLTMGRSHLKHTEGGDFREATYRAVRQGLMEAESVLLEPYVAFELRVPAQNLGRVLNDLDRAGASFESPELSEDEARVTGRAPAGELVDYPAEVTAFTGGRGTCTLTADGYEPCRNAEEVIREKAYNPLAHPGDTPNSVFCSHGAGFEVAWNMAPQWMHAPPSEEIVEALMKHTDISEKS